MISKETQEQIKSLIRIEEVVGEFVRLKRSGPRYLGLCPFHDERTPSFVVSPALGIFKCFGCGKAGDGIGFIMEHERLSFEDALRFLARKYNIEIHEQEKSSELAAEESLRESLYLLNDFAKRCFRQWLSMEPSIGLSYLKERGISETIIEKFQLGYAPAGRTLLTDKIKQSGYNVELAVRVGLIKKHSESEDTYDSFRDRIIFPIHNLSGRVIGFGGRIIKRSDTAPKYLNSPESDIYHKGKTLYGLHLAKRAIVQQDNCYLAEGYMDVIALHQAGVENVVASSGTSLTEEQIKLIRRFTNKVTLLYDGDKAGVMAAIRGADLLLEHGLQVRLVLFPDGEDPDSFTRRTSSDEFMTFLRREARDIVGFKAMLLLEEAGLDPIRRAEALKNIVDSIALIPDGFARNELALSMARMARLEEKLVISELNRARKAYLEKKGRAPIQTIISALENEPTPREKKDTSVQVQIIPEEMALIRWLVLYGKRKIKFYSSQNEQGIKVQHQSTVWKFIKEQLSEDNYQMASEGADILMGLLESYFESDSSAYQNAFDFLLQKVPHEIKPLLIQICADSEEKVSPGWQTKFGVGVNHETDHISANTLHTINALREERVRSFLKQYRQELNQPQNEDHHYLILKKIMAWEQTKKELSQILGRVILE